MIILKIKKAGYLVDIPGLASCRSPVDIDISKTDIRTVVAFLKKSGISDYEIVSSFGKEEPKIYTKKDFEEKRKKVKEKKSNNSNELNERFSNLENMLSFLISQNKRSYEFKEEQINNKLDRLERIISNKVVVNNLEKNPVIEDFDSFIPEIDVSGMTIKSEGFKTIKKEKGDLDDTADMLSNLIRK